MGNRILSREENIAGVTFAIDELVTKESYDITVADIVLTTPALLKVKSGASGDIKVTLAGKDRTDIILDANDVNEANVHVIKVFKTGTTISPNNAFFLWQ